MATLALAYRYEGHEPDELIEVDDNTAAALLRDGKARVPNAYDQERHLASLDTVAKLKDHADAHGIDIHGLTKKADIEAAIAAHLAAPTLVSESAVEPVIEAPDAGESIETTEES